MRNLDPDCPVVSKVPTERPSLFVRIDMGAPDRISLVQYRKQIIVQVYVDDFVQVLQAIVNLQPHLETMDMREPLVSGCDDSTGPVDFADPDIPQSRWLLTGALCTTLDYIRYGVSERKIMTSPV